MDESTIFVAPQDLSTRKCSCCGKSKPLTEFYRSESGWQRRCKECVLGDRKATRIYKKLEGRGDTDYASWPEELRELVNAFAQYQLAGGKVNYGGSKLPELIAIYADYAPEKFITVDESEGLSIDELNNIIDGVRNGSQDVVDALQRFLDTFKALNTRIALLEAKVQLNTGNKSTDASPEDMADYKTCFEPSGSQRQERANLLARLEKNDTLIEAVSAIDVSRMVTSFREMFKSIKLNKYVAPQYLRNILTFFEADGLEIPEEGLILYTKFVKPALVATQLHPRYHEFLETLSLSGVFDDFNPYEDDWESIPHNR